MLTDAEITHIAKLARIELDRAHHDKFKRELSSVLEYIEQLNAVDTAGVEPLYQVTGLENQTRADAPAEHFVMGEELTNRLVGQAPMHQGRLVKVKTVKSK